jgi:hypothetical protein
MFPDADAEDVIGEDVTKARAKKAWTFQVGCKRIMESYDVTSSWVGCKLMTLREWRRIGPTMMGI